MIEIILFMFAHFTTIIGIIYFLYKIFEDDELIIKAVDLSAAIMILAAYINFICSV